MESPVVPKVQSKFVYITKWSNGIPDLISSISNFAALVSIVYFIPDRM